MKIAHLKKISLACTMALCTQPLLGMENTNPFPVFNAINTNIPQFHGHQQQPQMQQQLQFPGNGQHNAYPWMNTVPQNQVYYPLTQYVMTPMGPYGINQVTYQTVFPVQQNHPAPFQGNHFIPQEAMDVIPQQGHYNPFQNQFPYPGLQNNIAHNQQGVGGMKRLLEPDMFFNNQSEDEEDTESSSSQSEDEEDSESSLSQSEDENLELDKGYRQLIEIEKNVSRAIYILFIRNEIQNHDACLVPVEIIHYIVSLCTPLNFKLDLEKSMLPNQQLLDFQFPQMLSTLGLYLNDTITDDGLTGLTKLTTLNLFVNNTITVGGLTGLTNLTTLNLGYNNTITDSGLTGLTKLTTLHLMLNETITDDGLTGLTNLATLDLRYNLTITDGGLTGLTNLTTLDLGGNNTITDAGVSHIQNLKITR